MEVLSVSEVRQMGQGNAGKSDYLGLSHRMSVDNHRTWLSPLEPLIYSSPVGIARA